MRLSALTAATQRAQPAGCTRGRGVRLATGTVCQLGPGELSHTPRPARSDTSARSSGSATSSKHNEEGGGGAEERAERNLQLSQPTTLLPAHLRQVFPSYCPALPIDPRFADSRLSATQTCEVNRQWFDRQSVRPSRGRWEPAGGRTAPQSRGQSVPGAAVAEG